MLLHHRICILLLAVLVLGACSSSDAMLENQAKYQDEELIQTPEFKFYHLDGQNTQVHFKIPPRNILFVRNPETQLFESNARIFYQIVSDADLAKVIANGTHLVSHKLKNIPDQALTGKFAIKLEKDHEYYIKLTFSDDQREFTYYDFFKVDKKSLQSKEYFALYDSDDNLKFSNYISLGESLKLSSEYFRDSTYMVSYFNTNKDYPPPIYLERQNSRMKARKGEVFSVNGLKEFRFNKPGLYHIQKDTSDASGLTLLCLYPGFPRITQGDQLPQVLRYLTSQEEFDELMADANPKLAVEEFWSDAGGSFPRTEKLLKTYYKRAQYANFYYSSYKEGWKSDRGLVYTIFGPPTNIYRNWDVERWVYGKEESTLPFEFLFVKINNPFSENDYLLQRDNQMQDIWVEAVETWRKGKVFNVNDIVRLQEEYERRNRNRFNNFWY